MPTRVVELFSSFRFGMTSYFRHDTDLKTDNKNFIDEQQSEADLNLIEQRENCREEVA